MKKILASAVLLALGVATLSEPTLGQRADQLEEGLDHVLQLYSAWWYRSEPLPDGRAAEILAEAAERGDAVAMFYRSRELSRGRDGRPSQADLTKAQELLSRAAETHAPARSGLIYLRIVDAHEGGAAAPELIAQLAAHVKETEDPDGVLYLAEIQSIGIAGRVPDEESADRLYKIAQAQGVHVAHYERHLHMKRWGRLVPAGYLLESACEAGVPQAWFDKGRLLAESPIASVREEGITLIRRAASRDHVLANMSLYYYLSTSSCEQEQREAMESLRRAARWSEEAKRLLAQQEQ